MTFKLLRGRGGTTRGGSAGWGSGSRRPASTIISNRTARSAAICSGLNVTDLPEFPGIDVWHKAFKLTPTTHTAPSTRHAGDIPCSQNPRAFHGDDETFARRVAVSSNR